MILTAIVFFCFNFFVPYYDDDVWYALRYIPQETLSPITGLGDILLSQYHHYMGENSRALIHIALQSLLATLPYYLFDIVNTLIFILMVWCMAQYTQSHKRTPLPITLLLIVAGIYGLLPDMDYLFYWAAGALNYLWTSVAILSFLIMWQHITSRNHPIGLATWGMAIWAFCCGFGHEALSLPVGAAVFIYMITHYRNIGYNTTTIVALAYGLGCVAILIAPGLENKASNITYASMSQYISALILTFRNLKVIPLWIGIVLIACCRKIWRKHLWHTMKENYFLLITAVVSFIFIASIRAGAQPMRIFYGAEFFALLLLLRYLHSLLPSLSQRTIQVLSIMLSALLIMWCILVIPIAHKKGIQHKAIFEQYNSDEDGIIFLNEEENNQWAQSWIMDLHHLYYEAPEAEWRGFVIPLVALQDTLTVPTPMIARNSDMSSRLYNRYIQVLPFSTREAIESPETFFTAEHKVVGNNPFYITPDSGYIITPLCELQEGDEWLWHYQPASWRDPSASIPGFFKRLIAPHTLPKCEPILFPDTVTLPDSRQYVIYTRQPYRRLHSIEPAMQ